jgi:hypothetical protein
MENRTPAERAALMTHQQLVDYLFQRVSGCAEPACRVCVEQRAVYDELTRRVSMFAQGKRP